MKTPLNIQLAKYREPVNVEDRRALQKKFNQGSRFVIPGEYSREYTTLGKLNKNQQKYSVAILFRYLHKSEEVILLFPPCEIKNMQR